MKRITLCSLFLFGMSSIVGQEIGLQLYSLRNQMKDDVEGMLAKISKWGITKIEDGNDGTYDYSFEAYKALLEKNNLEMVSISAPFDELKNSPESVLDRAEAYGAKYVVCFWIPHDGNSFTLADTNKALNVFNSAGKLLNNSGITLVYHPHGYEFRPHKGEFLLDYMIQNADNFAFEMDVYWFAHPGEDPVDWLRKYPNKFKLMHLKDCKKGVEGNLNGTSDVETNVVLGTGQIDIAAVVKEAKKMGLEYLFIEDESSKSLEQIPLSLAYLKEL